jgi:hypothetical protein
VYQQQEQQQEQQDAENPFLDPLFSRIKTTLIFCISRENNACILQLTVSPKQQST